MKVPSSKKSDFIGLDTLSCFLCFFEEALVTWVVDWWKASAVTWGVSDLWLIAHHHTTWSGDLYLCERASERANITITNNALSKGEWALFTTKSFNMQVFFLSRTSPFRCIYQSRLWYNTQHLWELTLSSPSYYYSSPFTTLASFLKPSLTSFGQPLCINNIQHSKCGGVDNNVESMFAFRRWWWMSLVSPFIYYACIIYMPCNVCVQSFVLSK